MEKVVYRYIHAPKHCARAKKSSNSSQQLTMHFSVQARGEKKTRGTSIIHGSKFQETRARAARRRRIRNFFYSRRRAGAKFFKRLRAQKARRAAFIAVLALRARPTGKSSDECRIVVLPSSVITRRNFWVVRATFSLSTAIDCPQCTSFFLFLFPFFCSRKTRKLR